MKDRSQYIGFPITLFKDFKGNIKSVLGKGLDYALYVTVQSLLDEEGCTDEYLEEHYYEEYPSTDTLEAAAEIMGLTFGNLRGAYDSGEVVFFDLEGNVPKTSISRDIFFEFYKNPKTDFEIATFLAFAALRSILQMQPYTKVSNQYVLSRMSGFAKEVAEVSPFVADYTSRHKLDKIKNELRLRWGLKLYGYHTRGYYVSFSMELKGLIIEAEKRRERYKLKQLQQTIEETRKVVLSELQAKKAS